MTWLLSPAVLRAVAVAAILAALAWGYHLWADHQRETGRQEVRAEWRASDLLKAEAEREVEKLRRLAAANASAGHEGDKAAIKTKFVEITKEVDRVVSKIEYRDRACFDDDGLRLINAAIAAAGIAANPREPGDSVPASAATP